MGAQLKADISRIRETAQSVTAICQQFEGAEDIVDGAADAVGSSHLADKLHDFATNWKIHRKRIVEDLTTFSDWATQAADAYEQTDQELAKALEEGGE